MPTTVHCYVGETENGPDPAPGFAIPDFKQLMRFQQRLNLTGIYPGIQCIPGHVRANGGIPSLPDRWCPPGSGGRTPMHAGFGATRYKPRRQCGGRDSNRKFPRPRAPKSLDIPSR
ncbi:hypothetical protein BN140_3031 [Methanoculleus bourgensis MS2]|uniref:Uncharacterized protein n=1 Tax=Methanoculleus bourgensis (strain ATCC 43281 / DSM 3045 / OCM 15 / MS2) TaxID=1201294 RepID=W6PPM1_METBM|nr:hypothetical protein BN140_3031 [Methanoculleus bourgensis MS2]